MISITPRKHSSIIGALVVVLWLSLLVHSSPVHASSIYDNVIDKTPTLKISGPSNTCSTDITTSWSQLLYQASIGGNQFPFAGDQPYLAAAYSQLQSNQAQGSGWGLWQTAYNGTHTVQLVILPTETQFSFGYDSDVSGPVLNGHHEIGSTVYFIEMTIYSCNPLKYTVRGPSWHNIAEYPDHIRYFNYDNPTNSTNTFETKVFAIATDNVSYPSGYEGEEIPTSNNWADLDGDGLTGAQESSQGTSDSTTDTDDDGLSDFIESQWNPSRATIFYDSSNYPSPTVKDLYVEIDWMRDNSSNRSFKPSSSQLSLLEDAYAAQGVIAHFDTGQYGGGNELPYYTHNLSFTRDASSVDFYDYKNGTETEVANFDTERYHIWHYMISGYQYSDIQGSSGASYISDDDAFISTGLIEDNPGSAFAYSNLDNAIAGTILHELGHGLYLTSSSTSAQHPACHYQYIDSYAAPTTYNSVMNYSYQMSDLLDYSDGQNGNDHDDWNAVDIGIADFATTNHGDQVTAGAGKKLRVGITQSQARQLRKEQRLFTHVNKSQRSDNRQKFELLKQRNPSLHSALSLRH